MAISTITVCDHFQDPSTLDPHLQFAEKTHTVNQQIFEGLLRLGPDGQVEPALAESWKRIDDLTVEFYLRQGIEFHNGEPFDADSVRFSIERYLDPNIQFPARAFISTIKTVQIINPHTVRIITHIPDGLLLHRLAAFMLMVPPRYVKQQGSAFAENPAGTGAFKFVSWEKGRRILLDANQKYWMKGYPKIDRLIFVFMPQEKQVGALLNGDVDIITEMPGTETSRVAASGVASVVKRPSLHTIATSFNINEGPLKDPRVRLALNLATDRNDLIRYDQLGNGIPMATLSMSGETGFPSDLTPHPYNPKRAKKLLREAGYARGLKLKILAKTESRRTVSILKRQWEQIGITLDLRWTNDNQLMQDLRSSPLDLGIGNCPNPMAHGFFIASIFLYSKSPYSITNSPELDRLIEQMITNVEPSKNEEAMREVARFIHRENLSLFTYQKIKTYGVRNGIAFIPYMTGMPYFYGVQITNP